MDDLNKQEVEFLERGMEIHGGLPVFTYRQGERGVPTKIKVYNDTRIPLEEQDDEVRVEQITVSAEFLGYDDNERHGFALSLSPELATVIANAMLTHASSVTTGDVVSKTLIQSFEDYTTEEAERRRWELEDGD